MIAGLGRWGIVAACLMIGDAAKAHEHDPGVVPAVSGIGRAGSFPSPGEKRHNFRLLVDQRLNTIGGTIASRKVDLLDEQAAIAAERTTEQVASPFLRLMPANTDSAAGLTTPSPVPAWLRALASEMLFFSGSAALATLLLLGVLASRWWLDACRLKRRVRDEQEIYDAIAGLLPADDRFRMNVRSILRRVETVFALRSAAMVLVSTETWQVEDIYSGDLMSPPGRVMKNAVANVRARAGEHRNMTLWRHPRRHVPSSPASLWNAEDHPDAIASLTWFGGDIGTMLVVRYPMRRRAHLENTGTLRLVAQLMGAAIRSRAAIPTLSPNAQERVQPTGNPSEMIGRVAHEFSNLLTSITGYAEMAADALRPGSSPYRYVEHIRKAGDRARKVVDEMLDQSRPQEDAPFNVGAAIEDIIPDIEMCVPSPTIVRAYLPDEPARIEGNALHLQQAVLNLCKNAGEAMKNGGTITVKLSTVHRPAAQTMTHGCLAAGNHVWISIEDDGPGILDADMERIFDPFFTTKLNQGGTGLGLAIVLDAVRRSGGVIDVRSRLGEGTRFDLYFPAISPGQRRAPGRPPAFHRRAAISV